MTTFRPRENSMPWLDALLSAKENAGIAAGLLDAHIAATDPHTQYALLASPSLTGNPTAPTQSAGNNSTRIATTAYTDAAITSLGLGSVATLNSIDLSGAQATGTLAAGRFPSLTGDVTTAAGNLATTLATVNANTGSFGSSSNTLTMTVNGKGLITAISSGAIAIAQSQVASLVSDLAAKAVLSGNNSYTGSQFVTGNVAVNGVYVGTNNYTANTQKTAGFYVPPYTASTATGTNCIAFLLAAQSAANVVLYGGGTSGGYAATHLRFFAAANTTTPTGTVVAEYTINGATFNIPVIISGDTLRIATSKTPASASATGVAGDHCWDTSYFYVCTATNTWKRAALSTW